MGNILPSCEFLFCLTFLTSLAWFQSHAYEFTFELPDNEKMCFYEMLKKDVKCTLEFQVIYENAYICSTVRQDANCPFSRLSAVQAGCTGSG